MTRLPSDGPERRIFIVSLRQFRNECDPPNTLHVDCPYAIAFNGRRQCGEECTDILAEHAVTEPESGFVIADGVTAIPKKPRRLRSGPNPWDDPFDAAKITARESELLVSQKSVTTLLTQLVSNCVTNHLSEEKSPSLTASSLLTLGELEARGIDVASFLKSVVIPAISTMLVIRVLIALEDPPVMSEADRINALEGWGEVLKSITQDGERQPSVQEASSTLLLEIQPRINYWLNHLDKEELLSGEPLPVDFVSDGPTEVTVTDENSLWIFDRFCQTYLENWRENSLHKEWLYLRGDVAAPCDHSQMDSRRIDGKRLSTEIANRATKIRQGEGSLVAPGEYVQKAIIHLRKREWAAAAAIYDVICRVNPLSGEAHNNLGFCQVPLDAERALAEFNKAIDLGRAEFANTAANKMLVLYLIGRNSSALEVGESWWQRDKKIDSASWMWDFSNPEFEVVSVESCSAYIANLAIHICDKIGDNELLNVWKARRE